MNEWATRLLNATVFQDRKGADLDLFILENSNEEREMKRLEGDFNEELECRPSFEQISQESILDEANRNIAVLKALESIINERMLGMTALHNNLLKTKTMFDSFESTDGSLRIALDSFYVYVDQELQQSRQHIFLGDLRRSLLEMRTDAQKRIQDYVKEVNIAEKDVSLCEKKLNKSKEQVEKHSERNKLESFELDILISATRLPKYNKDSKAERTREIEEVLIRNEREVQDDINNLLRVIGNRDRVVSASRRAFQKLDKECKNAIYFTLKKLVEKSKENHMITKEVINKLDTSLDRVDIDGDVNDYILSCVGEGDSEVEYSLQALNLLSSFSPAINDTNQPGFEKGKISRSSSMNSSKPTSPASMSPRTSFSLGNTLSMDLSNDNTLHETFAVDATQIQKRSSFKTFTPNSSITGGGGNGYGNAPRKNSLKSNFNFSREWNSQSNLMGQNRTLSPINISDFNNSNQITNMPPNSVELLSRRYDSPGRLSSTSENTPMTTNIIANILPDYVDSVRHSSQQADAHLQKNGKTHKEFNKYLNHFFYTNATVSGEIEDDAAVNESHSNEYVLRAKKAEESSFSSLRQKQQSNDEDYFEKEGKESDDCTPYVNGIDLSDEEIDTILVESVNETTHRYSLCEDDTENLREGKLDEGGTLESKRVKGFRRQYQIRKSIASIAKYLNMNDKLSLSNWKSDIYLTAQHEEAIYWIERAVKTQSGRDAFTGELNQFRSKKVDVGDGFDGLGLVLWNTLTACQNNNDVHNAKVIMMLCQTFYRQNPHTESPEKKKSTEIPGNMSSESQQNVATSEDDEEDIARRGTEHRQYIREKLVLHPIWKDNGYWEQALWQCAVEQVQTIPYEKAWHNMDKEARTESIRRVHRVIFSQMMALAHSMIELGCSRRQARDFLYRMCTEHQLSEKQRQQLLGHFLVDRKISALCSDATDHSL